jgi:hypothetical protein
MPAVQMNLLQPALWTSFFFEDEFSEFPIRLTKFLEKRITSLGLCGFV